MTATPHAILGVGVDATADEIHTARRKLARRHHPDAGGNAEQMQRINEAARRALRMLREPSAPSEPRPEPRPDWVGHTSDVPSFTVEALPAETFEALLIATAELGELVDEEPPYSLRALMAAPLVCWCQLDVVPDAGASTVSVAIARYGDDALPAIVEVRNAWITALNGLDWTDL